MWKSNCNIELDIAVKTFVGSRKSNLEFFSYFVFGFLFCRFWDGLFMAECPLNMFMALSA